MPKITELIQKLLGSETETIYMTAMKDDMSETVDINCYLDGITPCSKEFISKHINSFDLIILQTCPFKFFNFDNIINLLKLTGIIGFTKFPRPFERNGHIQDAIDILLSKGFYTFMDSTDYILFKKYT